MGCHVLYTPYYTDRAGNMFTAGQIASGLPYNIGPVKDVYV